MGSLMLKVQGMRLTEKLDSFVVVHMCNELLAADARIMSDACWTANRSTILDEVPKFVAFVHQHSQASLIVVGGSSSVLKRFQHSADEAKRTTASCRKSATPM